MHTTELLQELDAIPERCTFITCTSDCKVHKSYPVCDAKPIISKYLKSAGVWEIANNIGMFCRALRSKAPSEYFESTVTHSRQPIGLIEHMGLLDGVIRELMKNREYLGCMYLIAAENELQKHGKTYEKEKG